MVRLVQSDSPTESHFTERVGKGWSNLRAWLVTKGSRTVKAMRACSQAMFAGRRGANTLKKLPRMVSLGNFRNRGVTCWLSFRFFSTDQQLSFLSFGNRNRNRSAHSRILGTGMNFDFPNLGNGNHSCYAPLRVGR